MVVICEMCGAASRLICSETIRVHLVGKMLCGLVVRFVSRDGPVSAEANCGDDSQACLIGCGWDGIDCVELAGWIKAIVDEVVGVFFKERCILLSPGFIAGEFLVCIDHDEEATCIFEDDCLGICIANCIWIYYAVH